MKQRMFFLLIFLLCFTLILSAGAETLTLYRTGDNTDALKSFQEAHPDIQCVWPDVYYHTTYQINSALLTGEFNCDIYNLDSGFFDCQLLMSKEYCVDLSDNEIIRNELSKMHPAIASQGMYDGKIYAVPSFVSFEFWFTEGDAWHEASLTEADVPDTFPELLDFLTSWVRRIEDQPEPEISINNRWVEELYNEYSYTAMLTNMLIESYIMQLQYANEPLRFDNDELISLLDRVKEVGAEIYRCEPVKKGKMGLFNTVQSNRWPKTGSGMVSLRVNDRQPRLIKSYVSMYAINPLTGKDALAIDLVERLVTNVAELDRALMYQDAQPVLNPNYEPDYQRTLADISRTEEKLKSHDLDADTREMLQSDLRNYKNLLVNHEDKKYTLSPAQLQDYQSYVDTLFFPAPGIFFIGTEVGFTVRQMEERFAAGLLSSQELVKELDRLARMVELEDE